MNKNRLIKDSLYEQVARIAKAAASPKRLELLELLCQAPNTVETLAEQAGISMKLASAHLKALRSARLVENARQGKNVVYRIAGDAVARFWVILRTLAEDRLFELQDTLKQPSGSAHEWVGRTRKELLRKARQGRIVMIDVRPRNEYQEAHLPFARSLPLSELKDRLAELPKNKPIVAYCRGPFCFMAADAVKLLRAKGYDAVPLRDGVAEWTAHGETLASAAVD